MLALILLLIMAYSFTDARDVDLETFYNVLLA